MSAFYPIVNCESCDRSAIVHKLSHVAVSLGFTSKGHTLDVHETDAQSIVENLIRECGVTSTFAQQRLRSYQSSLSERYERWEYRWGHPSGEIILVICESNLIPFPSPEICQSGEIIFACGFVDFAMPDREIDRLGVDSYMQRLPLLYVDIGSRGDGDPV